MYNTEKVRDEIRRQKHKPYYSKNPWYEEELVRALDELDNERILFNSLSQCLKEVKKDTKEDIWHNIQIFLKDECRPDKETISVVDLKKALEVDKVKP